MNYRMIPLLSGLAVFLAACGTEPNSDVAVSPSNMNALVARPIHTNYSGGYTDPDFCGTGQAIEVTYEGVENLWLGPNDYEKSTGQQKTTYTNPNNGKSVEVTSSGKLTVQRIDDGGGAYTYVVSFRGQPEKIKAGKGGPILTKDVGYLTFYDHYAANSTYLGTDMVSHGPHPEADSDFALFCSVMTDALGL